MADFVELRLRSTATGKVVARSDKLSFCLTDVQPIAPPDPEPPVTLDLPPFECGADEQGINRGWDAYGRIVRCDPSTFGYRVAVEFDALPAA